MKSITHHHTSHSDHSLILLQFDVTQPFPTDNNRSKPYRFEAMWVKSKECEKIIERNWDYSLDSIQSKLESCAVGLLLWGNSGKDLKRQIDKLKQEIKVLNSGIITDSIWSKLRDLKAKLFFLEEQQSLLWKQRAK